MVQSRWVYRRFERRGDNDSFLALASCGNFQSRCAVSVGNSKLGLANCRGPHCGQPHRAAIAERNKGRATRHIGPRAANS